MTRNQENRLLPVSAIVAMLVAASVIIGLAYWVGDSIAPGLAALVQVTSEEAAAPVPRARSGPVELALVVPMRVSGNAGAADR